MKTVTVDIINDKAIRLLHDLESLQLIRVRRVKHFTNTKTNWQVSYKGAMQKQSMIDIDNQLNDLRNAWE